MTKQRRVFSAAFKREAADLVLKQNYSFIEASRSLGIGESALRRWVGQLQQERGGVTPTSKALTVLDEINGRWGRGTLRAASVPSKPDWGMRQEMMSHSYTTQMRQLWQVSCR